MNAAQIHSAINKASHETSRMASANLRKEAHTSGWPEHIAKSLEVTYGNGGFSVNTDEDYVAETLDHEYGTPDRRPNAAIRRTNNRTSDIENFFVNRIFNHIGDSL